MEAQTFNGDVAIQVGGLSTTTAETVAANVSTSVFTADKIVEVADIGGAGAWFLIDDDGATITPAADTGYFIQPSGRTRPFILKAGKVIEANAKIQINTLDIEE